MLSFRKGVLSLRGRAIARVEPIGDDPTTPHTVEHVMRNVARLYNQAIPRPKPHYFRPETTLEARFYHGGIAGLMAILLIYGAVSGSWPGFIACALLALALHWAQPDR